MYAFSEDFLQLCEEKEQRGENKTINPTDCDAKTFQEIIAYFVVTSTKKLVASEEKITKLVQEVADLKASVNTVVEENISLKDKVERLEEESAQHENFLAGIVNDATDLRARFDSLKALVDKQNDLILANERYTRGFCLRFNIKSVKEKENEDTEKILTDAFSKVGLSNIQIENSHRVGYKVDKKGNPIT